MSICSNLLFGYCIWRHHLSMLIYFNLENWLKKLNCSNGVTWIWILICNIYLCWTMCIRLNISFTNALSAKIIIMPTFWHIKLTKNLYLYINSISLNYTLYYISHDNLLRYFTPFIWSLGKLEVFLNDREAEKFSEKLFDVWEDYRTKSQRKKRKVCYQSLMAICISFIIWKIAGGFHTKFVFFIRRH